MGIKGGAFGGIVGPALAMAVGVENVSELMDQFPEMMQAAETILAIAGIGGGLLGWRAGEASGDRGPIGGRGRIGHINSRYAQRERDPSAF